MSIRRALLMAIVLAGSIVLVPVGPAVAAPGEVAGTVVRDQAGRELGRVLFSSAGNRTMVTVEIGGLTPGFHGFHLHAGGACTGDFVQSAGGHHNPGSTGHGDHAGDFPALHADDAGRARASFVTSRLTTAEAVGRAVIVHAGADNLAHIPSRYASGDPAVAGPDGATLNTGDAGARSGCGVVTAGSPGLSGGYWEVRRDGTIGAFGNARPLARVPSNSAVGAAPTPSGSGLWVAATDGSVFAQGDAVHHGGLRGRRGSGAVVGIASSPADARAVLRNQAGALVGQITLTAEGGRTRVRVNASGLTPGFHGIHVHGGSGCLGNFVDSAGGHYNPAGAGHGQHAADLPPLLVGPDGRASNSFLIDSFGVAEILGKPVIVHAAPDNLANIPSRYRSSDSAAPGPDTATLATGDAGPRVACGVVAASGTGLGQGYWLSTADGGVYTFGDYRFFGSMAGRGLAAPVVGIAATPSGEGYWLVAEDGGVFSFGDAAFFGSMGGRRLAAPVVGIAATPSGEGYWLAAADGGVFSFGDANFQGSLVGAPATRTTGIAASPTGAGYLLSTLDGGMGVFGDAEFEGRLASGPVVGVAALPQ